jgi:hypothetical protein
VGGKPRSSGVPFEGGLYLWDVVAGSWLRPCKRFGSVWGWCLDLSQSSKPKLSLKNGSAHSWDDSSACSQNQSPYWGHSWVEDKKQSFWGATVFLRF